MTEVVLTPEQIVKQQRDMERALITKIFGWPFMQGRPGSGWSQYPVVIWDSTVNKHRVYLTSQHSRVYNPLNSRDDAWELLERLRNNWNEENWNRVLSEIEEIALENKIGTKSKDKRLFSNVAVRISALMICQGIYKALQPQKTD